MTAIFAVPVLALLALVETAQGQHHAPMPNRVLPAAVALVLIVAFHAWRKHKAQATATRRPSSFYGQR